MPKPAYNLRAAIIGLWGVWLLTSGCGVAVAQTTDAQRAQNIRNQLLTHQSKQATAQDIDAVRNDVKNAMDALVLRVDTLEKDIADLKAKIRVLEARTAPAGGVISGPASTAAPRGGPSPSAQLAGTKMQVSACASGCDASKFSDAIALLKEGGTLTIHPGDYYDCIAIRKSMKLVGLIGPDGSRAHLTKIACNGKAAIDVNAPEVEIRGLKISEISVPSQNGACIRVAKTTKTLLIKDIVCLNSEDGLLGGTNDLDGVMTIEDSIFEGHGRDDHAHGVYINGGAKAVLRNVKILASDNGHLLKSGARATLVENSVLAALQGASGATVNSYGGGALTIRNSVLQLGPNTQNHNFLSYADEPGRIVSGGVHTINIENNWIIYDDAKRCCRWLFSGRSNILDKISVRNNKFVGGITPNNAAVDMTGNKEFADRAAAGLPPYDGALDSLPKPGS